MRSTFVDNSTLTAIQRLTGDIPVQRSFAIEGDASAFDQYIQALILYDEIAAVDDYKPEFRDERKGRFSEVRFISPKEEAYKERAAQARAVAKDIFLKIKGGELESDLLGDALKSLDLHVAPAWHLQSSDWFLRLRLLSDHAGVDLPKYGPLMSAIFNQLSQNKRSDAPVRWDKDLRSSGGAAIPDSEGKRGEARYVVNGDVKAFSAGLNWMSERSIFYLLMADAYDAAFVLHPIRHNFLAQFAARELSADTSQIFRENVLKFFSDEAAQVVLESQRIIGAPALTLNLPFFATWAIAHAGSPRAAYDHVLDVRFSPEALSLRKRFREIEDLLGSDGWAARKEAAKIYQAISSDIASLKRQFGNATEDDLSLSVSTLTLAPSLSSKSISRRLQGLIPSSSRKATTLLRNITRDILRLPSLRGLADKFRNDLSFDDRSEFMTIDPKIDPPRFRRARSSWKQPM
ncbi:hypothetical protein RCO27_10490 [Sphingosinicella sp. LHD-64]|uniref:hypothetical protein n=1 Tax=Sphingosinicella sp. LHD-64 TaxID=3072139 RepID=UPI00280E05A4|nr:hypothetical protein [Sphingosinicella sp. LHD-64]MDQ8756661.1 hypothetical protein [Sphingosinicella sp. LHD-64]